MKRTIGIVVVLLLAGSAQGAMIGVSFTNGEANTTVTGIAGPAPQANWNNVFGNVGQDWGWAQFGADASNLRDSNGASTTAAVGAWQTNGDGYGCFAGSRDNVMPSSITTDNDRLYNKYLIASEAMHVQITGIPFEGAYDVYSVAVGSGGLSVGGVVKNIANWTDPSTGLVEATADNSWTGNYLKWSGISGATVRLEWVDGWDNGGYFPFVQVGTIPEPATLSLLALGGLAVLRRRKHS